MTVMRVGCAGTLNTIVELRRLAAKKKTSSHSASGSGSLRATTVHGATNESAIRCRMIGGGSGGRLCGSGRLAFAAREEGRGLAKMRAGGSIDGPPEQPVAVLTSTSDKEESGSQSGSSSLDVCAVLFDMDGVLCDSEQRSRLAAAELFHELGYADVVESDFLPFTGTGELNFLGGVAKLYGVAGFNADEAKIRFYEIYVEKFALPNSGLGFPGAIELVKACKEAGLRIALASSAELVKINANLAAAGLPIDVFDAIASADSFERLKPAPDIFLAAARDLGIRPQQCVVIEDAVAGVQAANAAGMRCIAVTTSLRAEALESEEPALIKNDISEISVEMIKSLQYPAGKGTVQRGEGRSQSKIEQAIRDKGPEMEMEKTEMPDADVSQSSGLSDFLNAEVNLPGGYATTRRDLMKIGSASMSGFALYILLSRAKAMSYVSPKAILNQALGLIRPSMSGAAVAGENRVARFESFIADLEKRGGGPDVPDFVPTLDWLNAPPLKFSKELSKKLVILDFWTYCCINCMHILPDLAFLEKKYANKPVTVIGVHSAKFDNEKDLESIRNAVLRYDITHPVVNDGEMTMWRALGVNSWPTLAVVSPRGKLIGLLSGEGHREDVDELLQAALNYYGEREMLDTTTPIPMSLEKDKDVRLVASSLKFPGKIATDLANGRLFISDSNHHRIVVTDLNGQFIMQIGGAGGEGLRDGTFEYAAFNRPQGLAYHNGRNMLYVADTENHALREVDFVNEKVSTLAGNGTKGSDYRGGGKGSAQLLSSPWDVCVDEQKGKVFIAMAGQHQIWSHDIDTLVTQRFSGDGYERNLNGRSGNDSSFAQPSGLSLSSDHKFVYIADSESSSIRTVDLQTGGSALYAGGDPAFAENLFKFGDKDGFGTKAELQHPLGVLQALDGNVYIADSFNHKIKVLNPSTKEVLSIAGNGRAGFKDGNGTSSQLSEPAGMALGLDGKIFIADTNNNLIRVLDTAVGANHVVSTLDLASVPLPSLEVPASAQIGKRRRRRGGRKAGIDTEVIRAATVNAEEGQLLLQISIPQDYHFTKGASSRYEVDVDDDERSIEIEPVKGDLSNSGLSTSTLLNFKRVKEDSDEASESSGILIARINCKIYYCQQDDVCLYKAIVFEVPFSKPGAESGANAGAVSSRTVPILYSIAPKEVLKTQFV